MKTYFSKSPFKKIVLTSRCLIAHLILGCYHHHYENHWPLDSWGESLIKVQTSILLETSCN
jgi:hypothetical protein